MIMKTFGSFLTVFLITASLCSARSQGQSVTAGQPSDGKTRPESEQVHQAIRPVAAERYPRYLLRVTDVLQITFPISPEYDQTVAIQPDGYISLRGVGDLYIEGKSLPELIEALRKTYQQFLHDPIITVELKDFEKPYFIAGGEFGHPGKL